MTTDSQSRAGASGPNQAARRYPATAILLLGLALATMLPSALRVPLSGPVQTAELAPVPGKSSTPSANLAALGLSGSEGLGSGLGSGGPGGTTTTTTIPPEGAVESGPSGAGSNPVSKRCVGVPPRQTEDPLSPRCVPFFVGDNGGRTTKGVTATEIRIVIARPCTTQSEVVVDYLDDKPADDQPQEAAYQKYFSERYQMYGRRLHFYGFSFPCNGTSNAEPATLRSRGAKMDELFDPFAVIAPDSPSTSLEPMWDELTIRGIVTLRNVTRSTARRYAPLILNYAPDLDDRAELEADIICTKLAGRAARLSGDPTARSATRKFGLIYEVDQRPTAIVSAEFRTSVEVLVVDPALLKAALSRRCGIDNMMEATSKTSERQAQELQNMRQAGVTTVLFYGEYTDWSFSADSIKWYPEWFVGGTVGSVSDAQAQAPTVWANAFGVTYERRRDATVEQPWHQAFQEGCPGCPTPALPNPALYDDLLLLAWGIQAAGPKLTPANIDRGLHALEARASDDPYAPAAYFSPGNYSLVKDAALLWWDPSGQPPGDRQGGCYRLVDGGRRHRVDEWPAGDADIKRGEQDPCQGPR